MAISPEHCWHLMTIVKLFIKKKQKIKPGKKQGQLLLNTECNCPFLCKGLYRISRRNFSSSVLNSHILKNCSGFKRYCVLRRCPKDILIPKSSWEPVHYTATKPLPLLLLFIFVEGDTNIKKQMVISPSTRILLRTAVIVSAAVYKA